MDYCTFWPDGVWSHCCKAHDIAYDAGITRSVADLALQQCVAQTGSGAMSIIMLVGVTLFGWLFYKRKK